MLTLWGYCGHQPSTIQAGEVFVLHLGFGLALVGRAAADNRVPHVAVLGFAAFSASNVQAIVSVYFSSFKEPSPCCRVDYLPGERPAPPAPPSITPGARCPRCAPGSGLPSRSERCLTDSRVV
ncbi:hypothetical protein DV515_00008247, partial [Chloebia gouldiae]